LDSPGFFADDPRGSEVPALPPAPQPQPQAASQQDEGGGQGVVCDTAGGFFWGGGNLFVSGEHSCCFLWPFLSGFSLKKMRIFVGVKDEQLDVGDAAVGCIPPHPRMQSLEPFTHLTSC